MLEAYYEGAGELLLLEIDPKQVPSEVRFEGGFPHLYGPLPVSAVTNVRRLTQGGLRGLRQPRGGPGGWIRGLRWTRGGPGGWIGGGIGSE